MSRIGSKRVSFSPDPEGGNEEPIIYPTHNGRRRVVSDGVFSFSVRSSPRARRLLRRIGAGVAKTLRFMSLGRKTSSNTKSTQSTSTSSSSLSCSSSSSIYLVKSKYSSSSLSRSNSISAWSCYNMCDPHNSGSGRFKSSKQIL